MVVHLYVKAINGILKSHALCVNGYSMLDTQGLLKFNDAVMYFAICEHVNCDGQFSSHFAQNLLFWGYDFKWATIVKFHHQAKIKHYSKFHCSPLYELTTFTTFTKLTETVVIASEF